MEKLIVNYKDRELQDNLYRRFLRYIPRNLELSLDNECSWDEKELLHAVDMVDLHYRRYVIGVHKTLHRVMQEVRKLRSLKMHDEAYLQEAIDNIDKDIQSHELYELMPRHLYAKKKIYNPER